MTEPTITCPNCKTEIKLTESLAAPLLEATKQLELRLAQKDADAVKRDATLREPKLHSPNLKIFSTATCRKTENRMQQNRCGRSPESQVGSFQDFEQKSKELLEIQSILKQKDEKLAEAQKVQADLLRKQRELDDAKRELDLTVEKRVQKGLIATRDQAKKEAEEALEI